MLLFEWKFFEGGVTFLTAEPLIVTEVTIAVFILISVTFLPIKLHFAVALIYYGEDPFFSTKRTEPRFLMSFDSISFEYVAHSYPSYLSGQKRMLQMLFVFLSRDGCLQKRNCTFE